LAAASQEEEVSYEQQRPSLPDYPNLVKQLEVTRPEQVWVADITAYPWRTRRGGD